MEVRDSSEFPEVFTFNMNWPDRNPDATGVLKALVAIPEFFNVTDLFNHHKQKPQEYVLRGMICFGHNHYFAYFRRIFLKIGFLNGLDFSRINEQVRQIKLNEVKPETEWIIYDNDRLSFVQDNWTGVLHSCLEQQAYPTVLFYEKIVSIEEDAQYELSREFSYVKLELGALQRLAQRAELDCNEFAS